MPTTQEVALGDMHFVMPFTVEAVMLDVHIESTGVQKAWNGKYIMVGHILTLDNSGAVDWDENDMVTVLASN